jgi:chaperonin cofactor prefoldin
MNLNIFKRIADLEAKLEKAEVEIAVLGIQSSRHSECLDSIQADKQSALNKIEKRRAYARAYYQATKAKRAK